MKLALVAIITIAGAGEAAANQCNAYVPQAQQYQIEIGCPISVLVHPDDTTFTPDVYARRGAVDVPIASTATEVAPMHVEVYTSEVGDDCEPIYYSVPTEYRVFEITPDAVVGDTVILAGGAQVAILGDDGTCTPRNPEPFFYCDAPVQDFDRCMHGDDPTTPTDDEPDWGPGTHGTRADADGACSAGGRGTGSTAALLVTALAMARRRRASRTRSNRG